MNIDFAKVDAPLAASLATDTRVGTHSVFIRTLEPLSDELQGELHDLGARSAPIGSTVIAADLSVDAIRNLSRKPWVLAIMLAQRLRPLPISPTLLKQRD
jgi:hypothetical protein